MKKNNNFSCYRCGILTRAGAIVCPRCFSEGW